MSMCSCAVRVTIYSNGSIVPPGFKFIYVVTHSYSSRLFLCALVKMARVCDNPYLSTFLPICPGGENCMNEEDWPVIMEPSCETLFMCIITTLKEGVRSGGGISDVLRKPAASVSV